MWLRAVVVGTVGMATGVASHLLGGGLLPGAAAMGVLLVLTVLLASRFLLSWASPVRLVLLVVAAQGAWHLALSLAAGHEGDPAEAPARTAPALVATGERTGPLHDLYEPTAAPTGDGGAGQLLAHQVHHVTEQGPLMVLSHLAGAALLGLLLTYGERTLRGAVALAAGLLVPHLDRVLGGPAPAPLVRRPLPAPAARTVRPPTSVLLARHLPRRGPPALPAV